MQYLALGLGSLEEGLIYAIMAVGIFVSFRILDIPDLTVDGSFITGSAVSIMVTQAGLPVLGIFAAMAAGALAGCITGLLHTKLKVQPILAGILTMTGLYSINLMILGDNPTVSVFGQDTIFTPLLNAMQSWAPQLTSVMKKAGVIPIILLILVIVTIILYWFLKTQVGMSLRATGDNVEMVNASSINSDAMKILGLAIANGLVALSGAVLAQDQNFADAKAGTGMVVIGLASIIIGEAIFGKRSVLNNIISAILGAILYRVVITVVFQLGMPASYLKLLSAVIVAIALAVPIMGANVKKRRKRNAKA